MLRTVGRCAREFVEAGETETDRNLRAMSITTCPPVALGMSMFSVPPLMQVMSFGAAIGLSLGAFSIAYAFAYVAYRVYGALAAGWDEGAPKKTE